MGRKRNGPGRPPPASRPLRTSTSVCAWNTANWAVVGTGRPSGSTIQAGVADDEDVGVVHRFEIGRHHHPSAGARRQAPRAQSLVDADAARPHQRPRPERAAVVQHDLILPDLRHPRPGQDLHPALLQPALHRGCELRVEAGSRRGPPCTIVTVGERLTPKPKTYYCWKAKVGGMGVSEARRLRQLEDENRRPKKLVAEQALDNQVLLSLSSRRCRSTLGAFFLPAL